MNKGGYIKKFLCHVCMCEINERYKSLWKTHIFEKRFLLSVVWNYQNWLYVCKQANSIEYNFIMLHLMQSY